MAWDSQIDTPGDQMAMEAIGFRTGSVPLARYYKFTEVLVVLLNLQVQQGLSEELETGCHCPQSWREQG